MLGAGRPRHLLHCIQPFLTFSLPRRQGLISGANYSSGKKTVLVLFINGRCVECSQLRRSLEALYGTLLPKACRPWMFLDVRLPPRQVEVNMHPTKREVGFMHQVCMLKKGRCRGGGG